MTSPSPRDVVQKTCESPAAAAAPGAAQSFPEFRPPTDVPVNELGQRRHRETLLWPLTDPFVSPESVFSASCRATRAYLESVIRSLESTRGSDGWSLCHSFVGNVGDDDVEALVQCLAVGVNPDKATSGLGWRPIHVAAVNARVQCLKFLIRYARVDANALDRSGKTALGIAVHSLDNVGNGKFPWSDSTSYRSWSQKERDEYPDLLQATVNFLKECHEDSAADQWKSNTLVRLAKDDQWRELLGLIRRLDPIVAHPEYQEILDGRNAEEWCLYHGRVRLSKEVHFMKLHAAISFAGHKDFDALSDIEMSDHFQGAFDELKRLDCDEMYVWEKILSGTASQLENKQSSCARRIFFALAQIGRFFDFFFSEDASSADLLLWTLADQLLESWRSQEMAISAPDEGKTEPSPKVPSLSEFLEVLSTKTMETGDGYLTFFDAFLLASEYVGTLKKLLRLGCQPSKSFQWATRTLEDNAQKKIFVKEAMRLFSLAKIQLQPTESFFRNFPDFIENRKSVVSVAEEGEWDVVFNLIRRLNSPLDRNELVPVTESGENVGDQRSIFMQAVEMEDAELQQDIRQFVERGRKNRLGPQLAHEQEWPLLWQLCRVEALRWPDDLKVSNQWENKNVYDWCRAHGQEALAQRLVQENNFKYVECSPKWTDLGILHRIFDCKSVPIHKKWQTIVRGTRNQLQANRCELVQRLFKLVCTKTWILMLADEECLEKRLTIEFLECATDAWGLRSLDSPDSVTKSEEFIDRLETSQDSAEENLLDKILNRLESIPACHFEDDAFGGDGGHIEKLKWSGITNQVHEVLKLLLKLGIRPTKAFCSKVIEASLKVDDGASTGSWSKVKQFLLRARFVDPKMIGNGGFRLLSISSPPACPELAANREWELVFSLLRRFETPLVPEELGADVFNGKTAYQWAQTHSCDYLVKEIEMFVGMKLLASLEKGDASTLTNDLGTLSSMAFHIPLVDGSNVVQIVTDSGYPLPQIRKCILRSMEVERPDMFRAFISQASHLGDVVRLADSYFAEKFLQKCLHLKLSSCEIKINVPDDDDSENSVKRICTRASFFTEPSTLPNKKQEDKSDSTVLVEASSEKVVHSNCQQSGYQIINLLTRSSTETPEFSKQSLLSHPMISYWLRFAWHKSYSWKYRRFLVIYALYLILCTFCLFFYSSNPHWPEVHFFETVSACAVVQFFNLLFLLWEIDQIAAVGPRVYLRHFENYLDLLIELTMICFGFPACFLETAFPGWGDLFFRSQVSVFPFFPFFASLSFMKACGSAGASSGKAAMMFAGTLRRIFGVGFLLVPLVGFFFSVLLLSLPANSDFKETLWNLPLDALRSVSFMVANFDPAEYSSETSRVAGPLMALIGLISLHLIVGNLLIGIAISVTQDLEEDAEALRNERRLNFMNQITVAANCQKSSFLRRVCRLSRFVLIGSSANAEQVFSNNFILKISTEEKRDRQKIPSAKVSDATEPDDAAPKLISTEVVDQNSAKSSGTDESFVEEHFISRLGFQEFIRDYNGRLEKLRVEEKRIKRSNERSGIGQRIQKLESGFQSEMALLHASLAEMNVRLGKMAAAGRVNRDVVNVAASLARDNREDE